MKNQTPMLFRPEDLPERLELIDTVAKFEHKAKALTMNEELCFAICESLHMGNSLRATAKRFCVSHNTIRRMREELDRLNKLDTWKKRICRKMDYAIELTADALVERLEDGTMPANLLPITFGILWDKKSLADGDPTVRIETMVQPEVSIDSVRTMLEELRFQAARQVSQTAPVTGTGNEPEIALDAEVAMPDSA